MKRLILLSLLAAPLFGQGTIGSLQCIKRDRAVMMRWITTPAISNDGVRCKYDYDSVSLDRQTRPMNAFAANSGRRSCAIYDLIPDDDVYLGPQVSDSTKTLWSTLLTCTGACTNCGPGDDAFFLASSGCDCGGAGEYPKVHTDTEDIDPDPDPPVSGALLTPPTVTGNTYTVDASCSDFETQKNNAEANAATGVVAELLVPAQGADGSVQCELANATTFQLELIANGGTVYMHSNVDAKLLPPPGAQLDKTSIPYLAAFTWADGGLQAGEGYPAFFAAQDNARGYYIRHIEVRPPDWRTHTPIDMTITGIDPATDIITVSATVPAAIANGMTVVVDLTGTGIRGVQGIAQICAKSGATFKLSSGMTTVTTGSGCGTVFNLVGTYGSGGTVRRMVALPIEAHGTSGGLHTITVTGHKLAQFPDMTITGATASTITVTGTPSEYNISQSIEGPHASVVHVEGTGEAGCDGLWAVTVSGSVLTLNRVGFTPACTGVTTGTVHGHKAISIWKTSDDTIGDHEPRSHNWEVIDANTLQLLEVTAVAGVTDGYLFWDLENSGGILRRNADNDSAPMTDVTFDQVYFNWCMPYRTMAGFSFGSGDDSAVINSIVEECSYRRANPVDSTSSPDGRLERIHGNNQGGGGFDVRDSVGAVIQNNYLPYNPTVFADDSAGGVRTAVTDFQLRQNYFWRPDWVTITTASYRRHWFRTAFPMEIKSGGPRHAITGNYVKGWMSDFLQSATAFAYNINGSRSAIPNGVSHLAMEYNIFSKTGNQIFTMAQPNDGTYGAEKLFNIPEKFRFANNLVVHIDVPGYKSGLAGSATGGLIAITSGYRDFVIENNTWVPERTNNGAVIDLSNHRSSGMRVLNNIIGFTEGINTARIGILQSLSSGFLPAPVESGGYAAFQEFNTRGTVTDPLSEITGNIGLPMLKSSATGSFASKAASADPATTHCQSSVTALTNVTGIPDPTGVAWVGNTNTPCDESLNTRLAALFVPGTFTPTATYAGKGVADLTVLADNQGMPGPVTVTADDNQFDLSFHSPNNTECTIDRAPWAGTWATTWDAAGDITRGVTANGATQTKTFSATGLSAETQYAYRGFCAGKGFIGLVTTAGTP